jgi:hypothetical protein
MRVPTKTIDLTAVAELQESLRRAPPRPETKVKYAKAIELMASDIRGMRARGYGWDDISAMLAEKGLELSAKTIRTYLHRVGGDGSEPSPRRKRRRAEPVRAASPSPVEHRSQPLARSAVRDAPDASASPPRPLRPASTPPVSKSVAAASPTPGRPAVEDTPSWSFPVRPDTRDL